MAGLPAAADAAAHQQEGAAVVTGFVHGCFHLPPILLATTYNTEGSRDAAPVAVRDTKKKKLDLGPRQDRLAARDHRQQGEHLFEAGSAAVVATGGTGRGARRRREGFAALAVCLIAAVVLLRTVRVWRSPKVEQPAHELVAVPAA